MAPTRVKSFTWTQIQVQLCIQNCLNTPCSCGSSIESTSHFLLHCPMFHDKRHTQLSTLNNIDSKILESTTDSYLTQTLLFGCTSFDSETNTQPLTIFYPLKDLKKLFFKINMFFHMQLCSPFRTPHGLFHLFFFHFNLSFTFFFVFSGILHFQCMVIVTYQNKVSFDNHVLLQKLTKGGWLKGNTRLH